MRALAQTELLALWERGSHRHPLERTALLMEAACPQVKPEATLDLPWGSVTRSLLELRAANFGSRIDSHLDCENCGQRLELVLDIDQLLQPDTHNPEKSVTIAGLRVRVPALRDLMGIAAERNTDDAARRLLELCTLEGRNTLEGDELRAVEDALEAADPNADLALTVRCVGCNRDANALLDAGTLLWDEIEAHALRLLDEVHLLARAYGWSEPQILALSGLRRASYLAMVNA